MSERFEIIHREEGNRSTDKVWGIKDNLQWVIWDLTKSQAEQVKKALDEATGGSE